ncbi:SDR family oxidoreductase [Flavihumibacter petaseus]|uniref:NAD(P)H azoreductase n=1 Tax=Flavihumibacter petaseus NBRC 106054 TaxID=1220578 RepID=A0A0E9N6A6_9BACT|nr:SDR family oxidoreductase [Flavihumibacter petaseus]GAO45467.1 NAD(P)H azoreductase [Flavihumibacter petaseus NBRC 106054]
MTHPKILITGATGSIGSQLVQQLAAMQIPFRALVRSRENNPLFTKNPLADIRVGDLTDAASLKPALEGIEKAFLLTNSSEAAEQLQLNFVTVAERAGVRYLVKLSQFAADENSPVRFLRYHAAVENAIKKTGMSYTFLRPNLFMQGLLAFKDYIAKEDRFYAAVGSAGISAVDTRDVAAVATRALTEAGHENKIYNITGPHALTHEEMAGELSRVLGRTIRFIDVTPEQMESALRAAGFPEWQVGGLIEDYAHYARGEATEVSDTVKRVTGRDVIPFSQFVLDYESAFK